MIKINKCRSDLYFQIPIEDFIRMYENEKGIYRIPVSDLGFESPLGAMEKEVLLKGIKARANLENIDIKVCYDDNKIIIQKGDTCKNKK